MSATGDFEGFSRGLRSVYRMLTAEVTLLRGPVGGVHSTDLPHIPAVAGIVSRAGVDWDRADGRPQLRLRHRLHATVRERAAVGAVTTGVRVVVDALRIVVAHYGNEVVDDLALRRPVGEQPRAHLRHHRHMRV